MHKRVPRITQQTHGIALLTHGTFAPGTVAGECHSCTNEEGKLS